MPTARLHLIDPDSPGLYHLYSRCVRRAWLCGFDRLTGRSLDHRRDWIEQRLLFLCDRFAVDLHAYAIMSNHYHVVVHVDPQAPAHWPDAEVARRWVELTPHAGDREADIAARIAAIALDPVRLAELRRRLGSLSWLMRLLNEHVARRANKEDACTGRFWEGRFESRVLLDEGSWVAAMAYVDLNPVRAHVVDDAEAAEHTSLRHRLRDPRGATRLEPVASGLAPAGPRLDLAFADYRRLLRDTVIATTADDARLRAAAVARINAPKLDAAAWLARLQTMSRHDRRAVGAIEALRAYARRIGQRWLRGVGDIAARDTSLASGV